MVVFRSPDDIYQDISKDVLIVQENVYFPFMLVQVDKGSKKINGKLLKNMWSVKYNSALRDVYEQANSKIARIRKLQEEVAELKNLMQADI
ncbi:MAG: hypothetical protein ACRDD8_06255 [Bacteroidales bacterium]